MKRVAVQHLRKINPQCVIYAFGDSAIDFEMLTSADHGFLISSITNSASELLSPKFQTPGTYTIQQILLPSHSPARFGPQVFVTSLETVLESCIRTYGSIFSDFTSEAASRILSSKTRDRRCEPHELQEWHMDVGRFLAFKLAEIAGTQEIGIHTVHGGRSTGFQVLNEQETVIVPIMRGGEPMARGVWSIFRKSAFVHAKTPSDISNRDLYRWKNVVLVDFVINSGNSIREFIDDLLGRRIDHIFSVFVLIGVTQISAVQKLELEYGKRLSGPVTRINFLSLRTSQNKYVGVRETDTGNRLFGTIY